MPIARSAAHIANGADIAVSPKHTRIASRTILGDRLSRGCFRWRHVHLADPILPALAWPVARESRLSSPGHLAGVRSRQAVVPVSPASWFGLLPSPGGSVTALMPCRSNLPVRFAEAPLSFRPSRPLSKRPADRAPLTASAVRQISSEDFLRRVFRRCCGHRCQISTYVFPFRFSRFQPHLQVRCHRLDDLKLRPGTESRKRKMTHLSTDAMNRRGQVWGCSCA